MAQVLAMLMTVRAMLDEITIRDVEDSVADGVEKCFEDWSEMVCIRTPALVE